MATRQLQYQTDPNPYKAYAGPYSAGYYGGKRTLPVSNTKFSSQSSAGTGGVPVSTSTFNLTPSAANNQAILGGGMDGTGVGGTGNPQYDVVLQQLNDFLNNLKQKGQAINPNVEITPDKLKEFTTLAQNQIHPYFASQLKVATNNFLTGIGYSTDNLARQEQDTQKKYGLELKNIGESAAEKGFAQSGQRILDEQNLASATQQGIDTGRRDLKYNANTAAGNFAQEYGVPNFATPTLSAAPRVLAGKSAFDTNGTPESLYNLSPDVYQGLVSNQQNQEKSATDTLSKGLATDYATQEANKQTRSLTL